MGKDKKGEEKRKKVTKQCLPQNTNSSLSLCPWPMGFVDKNQAA